MRGVKRALAREREHDIDVEPSKKLKETKELKKSIETKYAQCAPSIPKSCPYKSPLPSYLSIDNLQAEERKIINPLYKHNVPGSWGYRAGEKGEHSNYEAELHGKESALYPITQQTDALFRLLQQGNAARSDITGKFKNINLEYFDETEQKEFVSRLKNFFARFLTDNNLYNVTDICRLAEYDLDATSSSSASASTTKHHSWFFGALVNAAKAVIFLSEGDIDNANLVSENFQKCIRELDELDELDELEEPSDSDYDSDEY